MTTKEAFETIEDLVNLNLEQFRKLPLDSIAKEHCINVDMAMSVIKAELFAFGDRNE